MSSIKQDHVKITTVHYREKHSAANVYQPGGVAQLTFQPLSNRVNDVGSNDLGRWSWQEICLDGTCSLFTYTGYRTCKAPVNSKKTMTWDQQVQGLLQCGIDDPDPQKQFFIAFLKEIKKRTREGHVMVVGMDINSCHDDDEVLDFLQDADLIDLFNDFYHTHPPMYMRSDNTMDLVFGLIDLLHWVVDSYILDPNDGPGDRSVIGIDLNYGGLIGTQDLRDMDPMSHQSQLLVSTDIKAIAKYLDDVKKELDAHYMPTHFKTLAAQCKQTGHCSQDDERIFQVLCDQMYKITKCAKSNCK